MMHLEVKLATKRADVLRCQYLIAEAYNSYYDIFFSNDSVNLNARIEPYPDRYVMGLINGDLVATAGLYLRYTYCERFGGVTDEDIDSLITTAGESARYTSKRKREYTKLVIRNDWEGRGLGLAFFSATHSKDFLQIDAEEPYSIVCCAKVSIFRNLYSAAGINTRLIKPFPIYQVHSLYRTEDDPMESRLLLPDIDISAEVYGRKLPLVCEFNPTTKGAPT